MRDKYDLSIIVACYNEEDLLEHSIQELRNSLSQMKYTYELIFVDDCSQDKTRELIKKLTNNCDNVSYIFHEHNTGRGGAVVDGIKSASGEVVGFIDIDLEVHCRYIPSMILAINKKGYDVASAFRVYKISLQPGELVRTILSIGYRTIVRKYLNVPLKDTETGYKFFRRESILPILNETQNQGWFWDTEIMTLSYKSGLKIKEIPCLFIRRADKISKVNVFRDTLDYLKEIRKFKMRLKRNK